MGAHPTSHEKVECLAQFLIKNLLNQFPEKFAEDLIDMFVSKNNFAHCCKFVFNSA